MNSSRLAEIEARAKAATEGTQDALQIFNYQRLAKQDIPDLIAHIRELESEIQRLDDERGPARALP